tara:strand:+ start:361 stop:543 length:183 start_codon:yes stop_codon:yes gene_type:complete
MITEKMLDEFLNKTGWNVKKLLLEEINDAFQHSELLTMNVQFNSKRGNLAEDIMFSLEKI